MRSCRKQVLPYRADPVFLQDLIIILDGPVRNDNKILHWLTPDDNRHVKQFVTSLGVFDFSFEQHYIKE